MKELDEWSAINSLFTKHYINKYRSDTNIQNQMTK